MEQLINYIKPELLMVAVVLYLAGRALKKAQAVSSRLIPLVLSAAGIVLCAVWVLATSSLETGKDIAMAVFTSVVQGMLVAGLSACIHRAVCGRDKKNQNFEK